MSWLKLHNSVREDPKVIELAEELGICEAQAVGHMVCLWTWCLDHAKDGNLDGRSTRAVERAAKWDGEHSAFMAAAIKTRLLDVNSIPYDGVSVHDWMDFQGSWKETLRQQKHRETKSVTRLSRDSHVTVTAKRRGEERRSNGHLTTDGPHRFDDLWELVPRKEGKKKARTHFEALLGTYSPEQCEKALRTYRDHVSRTDTPKEFVMKGATLFNNLGDWVQGCPRCDGPCGSAGAVHPTTEGFRTL